MGRNMESPFETIYNIDNIFRFMEKDIVTRLREFMDNEAMSCSMDFGCITPEYVHRMWGGQVALDEIETALAICKRELV